MHDYDGTVKIGCGLFEADIVVDSIRQFTKQYPNVEFNFMQYSYSMLVAHIRTGVVDAALGNQLCANALRGELERIPLFEERWIVAAHADSAFWTLPEPERAKLRNQLVAITYNNDYEPVRPFCLSHGLEQRAFSYSNFLDPILTMLQADAGIAVLPSFLRETMPPSIRMEDVFDEPLTTTFYIIYDKNNNNAALHDFVWHCVRQFEQRNFTAK